MTDAQTHLQVAIAGSAFLLGIPVLICLIAWKHQKTAQDKAGLLIGNGLVALLMSAFIVSNFYEGFVSQQVDNESLLLTGGSTLDKAFVSQTAYIVSTINIGTTVKYGGSRIVDRANLWRATGNLANSERMLLGFLGGLPYPTNKASIDALVANHYGYKSETTGRAFAGLGKIMFLSGKPAVAEKCFQYAISIFKNTNPDLMAVAENNLAVVYQSAGRVGDAKEQISLAFKATSRVATMEPIVVATIRNNHQLLSQMPDDSGTERTSNGAVAKSVETRRKIHRNASLTRR